MMITGFDNMAGYQMAGSFGGMQGGFTATQGEFGNPQAVGKAQGTDDLGKTPNGVKSSLAVEKNSKIECQTCKERKYQDGSDENVSFKSAAHISPSAAGARVRAHEGEHVSNAYSKAAEKNGKVLQASVAIHTAICPECGRTYVSGGTTTTKIKYGNDKNPYMQNMKNRDKGLLSGMNFDVKG